MTELTIRLDTIDKVKHFSHLMLLCPCEADLLAERYVINAKSIMGIFSLDLSRPLTMRIYGEPDGELLQALAPYRI